MYGIHARAIPNRPYRYQLWCHQCGHAAFATKARPATPKNARPATRKKARAAASKNIESSPAASVDSDVLSRGILSELQPFPNRSGSREEGLQSVQEKSRELAAQCEAMVKALETKVGNTRNNMRRLGSPVALLRDHTFTVARLRYKDVQYQTLAQNALKALKTVQPLLTDLQFMPARDVRQQRLDELYEFDKLTDEAKLEEIKKLRNEESAMMARVYASLGEENQPEVVTKEPEKAGRLGNSRAQEKPARITKVRQRAITPRVEEKDKPEILTKGQEKAGRSGNSRAQEKPAKITEVKHRAITSRVPRRRVNVKERLAERSITARRKVNAREGLAEVERSITAWRKLDIRAGDTTARESEDKSAEEPKQRPSKPGPDESALRAKVSTTDLLSPVRGEK